MRCGLQRDPTLVAECEYRDRLRRGFKQVAFVKCSSGDQPALGAIGDARGERAAYESNPADNRRRRRAGWALGVRRLAQTVFVTQASGEIGAADADGRGWGAQTEAVGVAGAEQPGDRAQAALEQAHQRVFLARSVRELLDLKHRVRAQREPGAVLELDQHEAARAGRQHVAFLDWRAVTEQQHLAVTARGGGAASKDRFADLRGRSSCRWRGQGASEHDESRETRQSNPHGGAAWHSS